MQYPPRVATNFFFPLVRGYILEPRFDIFNAPFNREKSWLGEDRARKEENNAKLIGDEKKAIF